MHNCMCLENSDRFLKYNEPLTSLTRKYMWLEGSQAWKQVENGHLNQRVFTGLVFQHPATHLDKAFLKSCA